MSMITGINDGFLVFFLNWMVWIFMRYKNIATRMRETQYWDPLVKTLKFTLHFVIVMAILFCGAYVLARLEDPEVWRSGNDLSTAVKSPASKQDSRLLAEKSLGPRNISHFWKDLELKYNFHVEDRFLRYIWSDIRSYLEENKRVLKHSKIRKTQQVETRPAGDRKPSEKDEQGRTESRYPGMKKNVVQDKPAIPQQIDRKKRKTKQPTAPKKIKTNSSPVHDKKFIFMKWAYFVIIATTTIGYGRVYPRTNNGKLFYIFFSIIGIVLMMTLLRSCGKILMAANKKFYTWVCRCVCKDKEFVSDQLMTVLSLCFSFFLFMVIVIWHEQHIVGHKHWSLIDTVYFWLVTFTTVGFGDKHLPLEVEIEHFTELVLFRVFGLSFLAGVIESIQSYIKYRKVILIRENKRKFKKISQIIVGNTTPIGMTANFLPGYDSRNELNTGMAANLYPGYDTRIELKDRESNQDIVHRLNRISASSYTNDDDQC